MKQRIHVDVEPLSEARFAKIENGLFAELDREARDGQLSAPAPRRAADITARRRRFVLGAVGIAAAAVVGGLFARSLFEPGGGTTTIEASRIVTGPAASHVALGTASVEVGPESAVVTSGDDKQGLLVVLEKGSVDCEVAPRKGRPPFVVLAGDVRVRVVGTRFVVTREGDGVTVRVAHGAVEVTRGGGTKVLHDGDRWPEVKPVPTLPTVVDELPVRSPSASPRPSAHPQVGAAAAHEGASDQKIFERAASLEAREPDAAMASYKKLGAGSGAWAAPSLFAAGRLAADRGKNDEARALLEVYLVRFPRGPNAADARRLLDRLR